LTSTLFSFSSRIVIFLLGVAITGTATVRAQDFTTLPLILSNGKSFASIGGISGDGGVIVGEEWDSGWNVGRAVKMSPSGSISFVENTASLTSTISSKASGVSNDGSVIVGFAQFASCNCRHAAKWDAAGNITDLGTLGATPSYPNGWSRAEGVSDDGNVIVGRSFYYNAGMQKTHAVKWDSSGNITNLHTLANIATDHETSAYAASADGSTIVGTWKPPSAVSIFWRAVKWDAAGNMTDLGTLGGDARAYGVSADGNVIVGTSSNSSNYQRAFKWTATSGMIDLGTLGGSTSGAFDASANGSIIVGWANDTNGVSQAVFWDASGNITKIDTGANIQEAQATGISNDGSIIVGYYVDDPSWNVSYSFAFRNGKLIDLANTNTELLRSAGLVRNTMVQRSAALALMMDYDCNVFGKHNVCISFIGRYSNLSSANNEGAGGMVLSYRLGQSWRIGAFLDYRLTEAKTSGINYKDDKPTYGAFLAFDQKGDRTGLQAKITGAVNRGGVTVTRMGALSNTEAGQGSSTLTSHAFSGELGWGIRLSDRWIATPFVGVRFIQTRLGAYSESQTAAVEFPITYGAYWQRTTFAIVGVKLDGMLTDNLRMSMELGGEYNLRSKMAAYTGSSNIPGLTNFSLTGASPSRTIRMRGAMGLSYEIAKNQRAGIQVAAQTLPFSSQVVKSVMLSYVSGF
jgi:probable HAF family extracellular repeat protein